MPYFYWQYSSDSLLGTRTQISMMQLYNVTKQNLKLKTYNQVFYATFQNVSEHKTTMFQNAYITKRLSLSERPETPGYGCDFLRGKEVEVRVGGQAEKGVGCESDMITTPAEMC